MPTTEQQRYSYERYGDIGGIFDMHQHFAENHRFVGRSYRFGRTQPIKAQHTHRRSGAMTDLGEYPSHELAHEVIATYDATVDN